MAGTEHSPVHQLGPQDARAAVLLSDEARWNQNEDDWRFFLLHGTVLGVHDGLGRLIATAALLPYASGAAWISMVLVTERWRRRGIATGLVDDCLALARSRKLTLWLDATPAGTRVYGPMGFTPTLLVQRLAFKGTDAPAAASPEFNAQADFNDLVARDREAVGFDRGVLLGELCARPDSHLVARNGALGLVRAGRKARHIGPLFADDGDQALALVDDIVASGRGPWLIDATDKPNGVVQGLTERGWTIERPFQRMRFGLASSAAPVPPMAGAGPEYG
jgi:GNAT superfamily N-acetyltransferase